MLVFWLQAFAFLYHFVSLILVGCWWLTKLLITDRGRRFCAVLFCLVAAGVWFVGYGTRLRCAGAEGHGEEACPKISGDAPQVGDIGSRPRRGGESAAEQNILW